MHCERYKDSLAQAALGVLGASAEADLRAHLAGCSACRAALERQQRLLVAIHRGLEASVAAEPSLDFAARVRRRLEEENLPARHWLSGWVPVAVGALAVFVMVAVWLARRDPASPQRLGTTQNAKKQQQARTVAALPPGGALSPAVPAARGLASRPAHADRKLARRVVAKTAEPEVLMPPGQREAILRLYEGVRTGWVDAASLLALSEPLDPAELRIAPLEIPRLEVESKPFEPGRER